MQLRWGSDPIAFVMARELTHKALYIFTRLQIDFADEKTYNRQVAAVLKAFKEKSLDKDIAEAIDDAGIDFIHLTRFCMGQFITLDIMMSRYKAEFNIEEDTLPSFEQVRRFFINCGYDTAN